MLEVASGTTMKLLATSLRIVSQPMLLISTLKVDVLPLTSAPQGGFLTRADATPPPMVAPSTSRMAGALTIVRRGD